MLVHGLAQDERFWIYALAGFFCFFLIKDFQEYNKEMEKFR